MRGSAFYSFLISRSITPARLEGKKQNQQKQLEDHERRRRSGKGLMVRPPPVGVQLVLVPSGRRLHLGAEPSYTLGPRRLAGTRERGGNDSGGEVERGGGGGRGEKGGGGGGLGGQREQLGQQREGKEGVGLDGYLCLVPAGYNRETEREAGEGRCRARCRARACTPM